VVVLRSTWTPGDRVCTESTTEPVEKKEDGTGEAGGTGVAEEAEKDWEGKSTAVDDGSGGAKVAQ